VWLCLVAALAQTFGFQWYREYSSLGVALMLAAIPLEIILRRRRIRAVRIDRDVIILTGVCDGYVSLAGELQPAQVRQEFACRLLLKATRLEVRGRLEEALVLYEQVVRECPGSEVAKDAASCIPSVRAHLEACR
jgi:hypothetical protein